MENVNKTLYIPLYGKAYVSRRGLFLNDKKAEEIWEAEGFPLKGKSKSKWLAYYMGVRSSVFDRWLESKLAEMPEAVVIHIGCGMDSRALRVSSAGHPWYDVDFPDVINERSRYYTESDSYKMIASDARDTSWMSQIEKTGSAIVVMEGVSMYMTTAHLRCVTEALCRRFGELSLLMDCYSSLAAKMSKYKNPINDVGVTQVYGVDDPMALAGEGLCFVGERVMVPQQYIDELCGMEKRIFAGLYAGNFSRKLYRLFEYRKA